ncbi:MAG: TRAP transporter small permease [Saccharospirillum sp.]
MSSRLSEHIDRLNQWLVGGLMALLVVNVWIAVLDRYLLKWQIGWIEELARYLMIWGILMAVPSCVKLRQHVRLTMVVERLPAKAQRFLALMVDLISIGFFGYIAFLGSGFVNQGLAQASMVFGVPMAVPYAAVPVAFGLAGLQTLLVMVGDFSSSSGTPMPGADGLDEPSVTEPTLLSMPQNKETLR